MNETSYTVTATISDGVNPAIVQSLVETAYVLGSEGCPHISQGDSMNPTDGLVIGVSKSDGGVIELDIDPSGLHRRDTPDLVTTFTDFQGATSAPVHGKHPVHGFHHHGVFVAHVQAMDPASGDMVGEGRKTLSWLGASETGEVTPMTAHKQTAATKNNLLKMRPAPRSSSAA